jgi:hypothetical protein
MRTIRMEDVNRIATYDILNNDGAIEHSENIVAILETPKELVAP